MSQHILFKTEDHVFSYRVAGLLVREDKILLQRDVWKNHAVPGGHVNFMETTEEALKREFLEEIDAVIGVDRLLAVQENFFMWGSKPCHQVHFYYQIHLEEENIPLEGEFPVCDQLGDLCVDLDFVWVPLEELKNISVYPHELEKLLHKREGVMHFVSSELE